MWDLNSVLKEQLRNPKFARPYFRVAPFHRLSDQIHLLRKQRGLSQQELAAKAETTQAVVSRLENASVRASLETVIKLADALDAVVELKLIPMEDVLRELEQDDPTAEDDCSEGRPLDNMPGIVYFGQSKKATCQDVIWFQPDTGILGVRKDRTRLQKQLEVA